MAQHYTLNRPLPVARPTAELFRAAEPVVSVYLDTRGTEPNTADQIAVAWRNARGDLARQGAPEVALASIDPLTDGAHSRGECLVAFAAGDGLLYAAHLPQFPARPAATVGPVAHLGPLLSITQRQLPYVVVATDRLGADLLVVKPDAPDLATHVDGDDLHVTRSAPGGWSQRRFQQRAENRWESNAGEVAEVLTQLVDKYAPRLVVVSGDVRAVQFLRDQVPDRVGELLREVEGELGLAETTQRAAHHVAALADEDMAQALAAFNRELGQRDLAVLGAADTLATLARGQVDTLLMDPDRLAGASAWYGPEPQQVAASEAALRAVGVEAALRAVGVDAPRTAALEDLAVRAAFATDAAVLIVPPDNPDLAADGIGALLRYR